MLTVGLMLKGFTEMSSWKYLFMNYVGLFTDYVMEYLYQSSHAKRSHMFTEFTDGNTL